MMQDIFPSVLNNQYKREAPKDGDYLIFVVDGNLLVNRNAEGLRFPKVKDIDAGKVTLTYLFSIDDDRFFLPSEKAGEEAYYAALLKDLAFTGAEKVKRRDILHTPPKALAFAGALACQIGTWYENNRFCGHCGRPTVHSDKERMLYCPECGNIIYPRINPVIITGILDGDRIVVSRYAAGPYRSYALIAGYNEVGESIEDTLRREVMEEVGLEVENIRYYKCQPWPVTDTLLFGFFCDVRGTRELTVDKNELADAVWLSRKDAKAELVYDGISLTREMLMLFADGKEPK